MDRPAFADLELLTVFEVEAVTGGVPHVVLGDVADGTVIGRTGVDDFLSADETVGGLQRHGTDDAVAQVQCSLEGQLARTFGEFHRGGQ